MDFCGPFPNGEYALVMTDQYSRYPEVEFVRSTSNRPVQKKLKKIFSTYGVPKRVQTDNGPPFNSNEFQRFADVTGFQHKKITPRHPKAQGQVEGFNKLVNKTASIASQEGLDLHEATYDMLQAYRSTPHPATKATPYELLMNRQVRTKLDHFPVELSPKDKETREMDASYKKKVKQYHDTRHNSKRHKFQIGNAVVVKREKKRKTETIYEPYIYIITDIKGSTIFARRISDGKTICRDSSRVKRLNGRNDKDEEEEKTEVLKRGESQVPPSFSLNDRTTINNVEIEDQESTDNAVRHDVEDSNHARSKSTN